MKSITSILVLNILFVTGLFSQEEFGLASYYSDLFHGKPTASGELYDKGKLTCAHKTLPFGTLVKVTRLDNNKSVQVRVNDRGPFISGRVVELSKEAANRLELPKDGSTRVKVEVVSEKAADVAAAVTPPPAEKPKAYEESTPAVKTEKTAEKAVEKTVEKPKTEKAAEPAPAKTADAKTDTKSGKPVEQLAVNKKPETPTKDLTAKSGTAAATSNAVLVKGADYKTYDLFQIELKRPEKKGYGVQVASLATQDALFKKLAELQGDWFSTILVSVQQGPKKEQVYKVILGSFATEGEANIYKANLKKNKKLDGFVVDLSTLNKD